MITDEMLRAAWAAFENRKAPTDDAWWAEAGNYEKFLDDRLRTALEAADRAAWQPVETAPHGTPVLLGWFYNNERYCEVGTSPRNLLRGRATHWRPLPEPPEAAP